MSFIKQNKIHFMFGAMLICLIVLMEIINLSNPFLWMSICTIGW